VFYVIGPRAEDPWTMKNRDRMLRFVAAYGLKHLRNAAALESFMPSIHQHSNAELSDIRIDAHHHLWNYQVDEFSWIDSTMAALCRDFTAHDLSIEMERAGMDAAVAVQARQSLEETRWLLQQAATHPRIAGVVGWAPIADDHFPDILSQLTDHDRLVGLRHVVQAEPAGFLDRDDFNRGVGILEPSGLSYDILITEGQIEEAARFVDRHPYQRFVVDHCAKPRIAAGELEPWRTGIRALALRPNVTCKLSGLVTEANWTSWTLDDLRPYLDTVLDAFGPVRVMAGSDWPVCLVATSYTHWWDTLHLYTESLSDSERRALYSDVAQSFYRLKIDATACKDVA
jgi:L-fuconolactonase